MEIKTSTDCPVSVIRFELRKKYTKLKKKKRNSSLMPQQHFFRETTLVVLVFVIFYLENYDFL